MDDTKRLQEIIRKLKRQYPEPATCLVYSKPFELLVATILSAQTTDAHVNKVTATLFKKYRSIADYASTPLENLQNDLKSINFYNNKAKNIQNSARMVLEKFAGVVPNTMEELILLPGVARKTANIVLSSVYGINEGIAVDTHVIRLSGLLGLTAFKDPVKIERDLMALAPKKDWAVLSHLLILHGRSVCKARNANHAVCVISHLCPSKDS